MYKAPKVTFVKLRSSSPVPGDIIYINIYQITQHKTYLVVWKEGFATALHVGQDSEDMVPQDVD